MVLEDLANLDCTQRRCVLLLAEFLGGLPTKRRPPPYRSASVLACASRLMSGLFDSWDPLLRDFDSWDPPSDEDDPEPVPRGSQAIQLALDNFNVAYPPGRIVIYAHTPNERVRLHIEPNPEPALTDYRSAYDLMGKDIQEVFRL